MVNIYPIRRVNLYRLHMKPIPLIFAIVLSDMLSVGLGFAGEPSQHPANQGFAEKRPGSGHPPGELIGHQAAGKSVPPGVNQAHFGEPSRASRINGSSVSIEGHTKHSAANNLHPPASNKTTAIPANGLMMNKSGSHREHLAGLSFGNGFALPSPGMVRGRAAKSDLLGGLAASSAKTSAGAINGSTMKRKP